MVETSRIAGENLFANCEVCLLIVLRLIHLLSFKIKRKLPVSAAIERALSIEAHPLRPDRKEDDMSSAIDTTNLAVKDLSMLKAVLYGYGYRGDISVSPDNELRIAARLIIRLFHQGFREPAQLSDALHRNFDRPKTRQHIFYFSGMHRYAVQGITPLAERRIH